MSKVYRVAEAARELGRSESFLREAEKKDKIPRAKRDLNGWRVYTEQDIKHIRQRLIPGSE